MTTSGRDTLRNWFMEGVAGQHKYMIVVCDTITKQFYPVYCSDAMYDQTFMANDRYGRKVMEVYDLTHSMAWQIQQRRTMNVPFRSKSRQGWCEQANS